MSRETRYGDMQKLLMKEMSGILHDDILISAQRVPLFKIRVLDGFEVRIPFHLTYCKEFEKDLSNEKYYGL